MSRNQAELDKTLAASLTAEDTGLLPFLPYLLQDLWELGGDPQMVVDTLRGRIGPDDKVLDLACGKGAVSVRLAKALGCRVLGVDLIPEFVAEARQKAAEHGVAGLCSFEAGDANQVAAKEQGWDCVIFSAAGNVLGPPPEMLQKLAATLRDGGLLLLDESHLPEDFSDEIRYQNYDMHTKGEWDSFFRDARLSQLRYQPVAGEEMADVNENDMTAIAQRVAELSQQHPEKRALFEGYLQSQLNEVHDVENSFVNVVWLLQKDAV